MSYLGATAAIDCLLVGQPCAGKGTQLKMSKELYPEIIRGSSSGDLFRRIKSQDKKLIKEVLSALHRRHRRGVTEKTLTKLVGKVMKSGGLIDLPYVRSLIDVAISHTSGEGITVWDGFTRNERQARYLFEELHIERKRRMSVIYLDLSPDECIKRMSGRAVVSQEKREDDNLDTMRERIQVFQREIDGIRDFFQTVGQQNDIRQFIVDASPSPDKVAYRIQDILMLERRKVPAHLLLNFESAAA